MAASLRDVLLFAFAPALALVVGGTVAVVRPPASATRSRLQHLAAGVVFAAVAGELLPQELEQHRPLPIVLGFAAGVALMLGIRQLTEGAEDAASGARGLVANVGVDLLIDGLLVGVGFAAGAKTGVLITVALTFEVLFLGLASIASLSAAGWSRRSALAVVAGFALLLVLGGAVGGGLLGGLTGDPFLAVLGFGSAALLYLVIEELLVEAHTVPETPVAAALFFVGFLILFVVEMLF